MAIATSSSISVKPARRPRQPDILKAQKFIFDDQKSQPIVCRWPAVVMRSSRPTWRRVCACP
ncbi:MAG: hypothetical protein ACK5SI_04910, partial [Planctomycetia bacterium]